MFCMSSEGQEKLYIFTYIHINKRTSLYNTLNDFNGYVFLVDKRTFGSF